MNENYRLASLKEKENNYLKVLEDKLKMELGKDFVLIAWEKKE